MKIDPKALADHLKRIHIPGEIEEVVLRDRFSCVAKNKEGDLIAWLPGFGEAEGLPEPVGVSLGTMIGFLQLLAGAGCPEAEIDLTDLHLVLAGSHDDFESKLRLRLLEPALTTGHIRPELAEELVEGFSFGEALPINLLSWDDWYETPMHEEGADPRGGITKAVPQWVKLLKAKRVSLSVGPEQGWVRIVGKVEGAPEYVEDQAVAEIPHGLKAQTPFDLEFPALMFARVLSRVRRFPGTRIRLSGPRGPVLFQEDPAHRLLVFPAGALRTLGREKTE